MLKTPGGLVRVTAVNDGGHLHDMHISGDFFFYPAGSLPALEKYLEGISLDPQAVSQAIEQFYARESIEAPGLQPQDFTKILDPSGGLQVIPPLIL